MGRLTAFVHVTIDGFFAGPHGEIDWFKFIRKSDDYDAYTHEQAGSGDTLVFGRATYEIRVESVQERADDPEIRARLTESTLREVPTASPSPNPKVHPDCRSPSAVPSPIRVPSGKTTGTSARRRHDASRG